jgi:uncharacterized protein YjbI with pentapeptide repeats
MLIVLDNLTDIRQLADLLPPSKERADRCHILAISILKLTNLTLDCTWQHLEHFKPDECRTLFQKFLGQKTELHHEVLSAIGRQLEFLPQLVAVAAQRLGKGQLSPELYLRWLRQRRQQSELMGRSAWDGLEAALNGLAPEQTEVFDFIGVLGEGEWDAALLAAVVLQPLEKVKQALSTFVDIGLVRAVDNNRYSTNTLVREFAKHRFGQRDCYTRQSAQYLLAHACLDRVRNLELALATPSAPGHIVDRSDPLFVQRFRDGLQPDLPHIRGIFRWAEECEAWDILVQFSDFPYRDLLHNLIATGCDLRLSLTMATLREPLITSHADRPRLQAQSVVVSEGISIQHLAIGSFHAHDRFEAPDGLSWPQHAPTPFQDHERYRPCELSLNIIIGQIIEGVLKGVALIDAKWIGVQANGIIFSDVDMAGSHFLGCDMRHSAWIRCDARRVMLRGANLSAAVIEWTQLRGADLKGADLRGAVLEHVDLRGADLRDVQLTGAILDDVDLRGANLHGTALALAWQHEVRWDSAQVDETGDESSARDRTELTSRSRRQGEPENNPHRQKRPTSDILDKPHLGGDFSRTDLRALHFVKAPNLARIKLFAADLRAADLAEAQLPQAQLTETLLQAANLSQANLRGAKFCGSQLRGADLSGADLSGADLSGADLSDANLADADLRHAILRKAILRGAILTNVDLTDADLTDAMCAHANLRGAVITDEQLAQTHELGGATLPQGHVVLVLKGDYKPGDIPADATLRFARFQGTFIGLNLLQCDMFGTRLSGTFIDIKLTRAKLMHARLDGIFVDVNLSRANLTNAKISGDFSRCNLRVARFTDADLRGANLVDVDLRGAHDLHDAQLEQAHRLRASKMTDGHVYNGRFNLAGEIQDAIGAGIDPRDASAMERFSRLRMSPFKRL